MDNLIYEELEDPVKKQSFMDFLRQSQQKEQEEAGGHEEEEDSQRDLFFERSGINEAQNADNSEVSVNDPVLDQLQQENLEEEAKVSDTDSGQRQRVDQILQLRNML